MKYATTDKLNDSMKAKVVKYKSDGNTVVAPYMELEQMCIRDSANNVPLQDVSVMLGHASTRMTPHYARVMNSSLKEAMNLSLIHIFPIIFLFSDL